MYGSLLNWSTSYIFLQHIQKKKFFNSRYPIFYAIFIYFKYTTNDCKSVFIEEVVIRLPNEENSLNR